MNIIETVFLGVGLSMDAACVGMTNGLTDPKMKKRRILLIALFFGLFQGVMPTIGYFAGSVFTNAISKFLPWIALVMLCAIGGKMIIDGVKNDDDEVEENKFTIKGLVFQAIATSIDALTVGVLFVSKSISVALLSFGIIAVITFLLTILAVVIGKKFGTWLSKKAFFLGGGILIAIGLKIFIEYLIDVL